MKNKKLVIISIVVIGILIALGIFLLLKNNNSEDILVSKEYFVKFSGGVGEVTYHAYVYETDSETKKYKYVLTTATTKSWGSSEWDEKTNKEGFAKNMEEVVDIAKEHGCGYVIYHDNNYSLEEFLKVFNEK